MNRIGSIFLAGILIVCAICALLYLSVTEGWIPARGDVPASDLERWIAHHALNATLEREATDERPIEADASNIMKGAKIYSANCAVCHGTPLHKKPNFAKGFNPEPTLFGDGDLVDDDPESYTYWKIDHGIKFTGMPSFNKVLSEKEMWEVTLFLKHMNKLPPPVDQYWKSMK